MTKISPFKGWRYNPNKISDLSKVVAPPYDVIGPDQLKKLHRASPFNVSRIDLPQKENDLGKYEVAKKYFLNWKEEGVLIQDGQPSLYLYFQSFNLPDGRIQTRKGFFARRLLETFEEGGVKPHEKTFSGPKEDRLKLTQATQANLSPIFGLYGDLQGHMDPILEEYSRRPPDLEIRGKNNEAHRLWHIEDPDSIQKIISHVHDRPVMIADGHHRYETALNYREQRKSADGESYRGDEDYNYVLMYFCSLQDPGLIVLPTHRVLKDRPQIDLNIGKKLISQYAAVKEFSLEESAKAVQYLAEEGRHEHALGWIHDKVIEVLTFDREKILESDSLNHLHFAVRDLDATILHDLVLEEILGIPKGAQREYGNIQYIKNTEDTLKLTQEKKSFGFLMNATKIPQLEAVTEIGATMPQKSTYFYPKLLTGLVFNDLG